MKFTTSHHRSFMGNDVTVSVTADERMSIASVRVTLDDATLDDERLPEGSQAFESQFLGAGNAGPNMEHVLVVTALDQDGQAHSSTTRWTDLN